MMKFMTKRPNIFFSSAIELSKSESSPMQVRYRPFKGPELLLGIPRVGLPLKFIVIVEICARISVVRWVKLPFSH